MTALAADKARRFETWKYKQFTLASGTKAYKGGRAVLNTSNGKVVPATTATGRVAVGIFAETVDAAGGDKLVNVDLEREIQVEWFANDGAPNALAAADVGSLCYMLDDATVTKDASGRSIAGRVWAVDTTKGVAVEKVPDPINAGASLLETTSSIPAFAAGDSAPASITNGAVYDVPTTAGVSTITLPAASPDGTQAIFTADGTKNGHTVQYRDATGPVNLTTALTASKRHLVVVTKAGGKWFANAYVSP